MKIFEYLLLKRSALEELAGGYISDEILEKAAEVLERKTTQNMTDGPKISEIVAFAVVEKIRELREENAHLREEIEVLRGCGWGTTGRRFRQ